MLRILDPVEFSLRQRMPRPYLKHNLKQLLEVFSKGSKDIRILTALEAELRHRSTLKAKALARDVDRAKEILSRRAQRSAEKEAEDIAWRAIFKDGRLSGAGARESNTKARRGEVPPPIGFGEGISELIEHGNTAIDMDHESSSAAHASTEQELIRLSGVYDRLRERLLDMSLRNPMLNYKVSATSKRQLQFVDEVPEQIYTKLVAEAATLDIVPLPEPEDIPADEKTPEFKAALDHAKVADQAYLDKVEELAAEDRGDDEAALIQLEMELRDRVRAKLNWPPRPTRKTISPSAHARSLGIDPSPDLPLDSNEQKHRDKKLQSLKWPDVLDATLSRISDDARTAEQEMGLSTLFLVFGFLEWYEAEESTKRIMAPLLLLPVKLDKVKSARGKTVYYLTSTADTPETNLSLEKRIERDFNRLLPQFVADEDDLGSINDYLSSVSETVEDLKRWRVKPWLMLGHFGFGRLAMYTDLGPDRWTTPPVTSKLVEAILRGTDTTGDGDGPSLEPPDDYEIEDPEIEKVAPFLVHDADSSQHSALVDALKGKNLVIHGPPGTGKSQTICNLIANAIAKGKRVLFLAEKQAALEVVKRRLDAAGLGEFCLELHSDRVASGRVIDSLRNRHQLGYSDKGQRNLGSEQNLRLLRSELRAYLLALHQKRNEDRSVFDDIWASIRAETVFGEAFRALRNASFPAHLLKNDDELNQARYALSLYGTVKRAYEADFGGVENSTLSSLRFGASAHQGIFFNLKEHLEYLFPIAKSLGALTEEVTRHGIADEDDAKAIMTICDLLPQETADPEIVTRVSRLGTDQVRATVAKAALSQELENKLSTAQDLSELTESNLTTIPTLFLIASGTQFADLPLHALEGEAKRAIEWAESARRLAEALRPLMRAAGYEDVTVSQVSSLAYAARFFADVSADTIAWIAWSNNENEPIVLAAHKEWTQLVAEKQSWAKQFSRLRRLPSPDELLSVASLLRKRGFARALGALTGDGKRIDALVSDLGVAERSTPGPDELERFATFLSRVEEFEASEGYGDVFGSVWSGLATPLDFINAAIGARQVLRQQLAQMTDGSAIFERLDLCSEKSLLLLRELAATGVHIDHEEQSRLGADGIEETARCARAEADKARQILDRELRSFGSESRSLRELAELAELEVARRRAFESLRSSEGYQKDPELFSNHKRFDALSLAADWLDVVSEHIRKPELRQRVLSIRSEDELRKMFDLAASYSQVKEDADARIEIIRKDCDISGLDQFNPATLSFYIERILLNPDELKRHLSLNSQRQDVTKFDLGPFLNVMDKLEVSPTDYVALLEAAVAWRRADRDRRMNIILGKASGPGLEARRNDFIEHDTKKMLIDRKAIAGQLAVRRPPGGSNVGPKRKWTEMALLQNEFGKEKRFVPVRDLIVRAGRAIQTLKPCFLMSPLSLAKYLPAGKLEFDLLVVDEASQMRPEDALGALLRVKQLVVVGDTKQLPPTDFFHRIDQASDSDDVGDDIDDESILEVCQKTFGQVRMLKWHYRSRCESLIAFSNREFYKSALITFPSAEPGSFSIDLVRVDGTYKAGCNPQEAQRVAEEAIALMRHYADFERECIPTIGLVAVNTKQRDRIFEELRQLEAGDERVERYREKVLSRGEPVFVKNLENVQGDERDFILVSLTYGREEGQTQVMQRFGPIGMRQGHRRLNVLFSRARSRIGLFTSMGSEDVRPTDTSSDGVHVLKRYLKYAEHQGKGEYQDVGEGPESEFELEVAERLRKKGYRIETQIGVSGYRIDLGVRDPNNPALFIAGIECDGARYHSSKSARERDRLREEILRGLGWKILRVWSTDWFDNPAGETDKLCQKIETVRADKTARRTGEYRFLNLESAKSHPQPVEGGGSSAELSPQMTIEGGASGDFAVSSIMQAEDDIEERGDLASKLRQFREQVIACEMMEWEPQRSILRDGMIETLIAQRVTDPADWFHKVPAFQRMGTNPVEKDKYFSRICELIDEQAVN